MDSHKDRHDSEFYNIKSDWADEGCLPESCDTDEELANLTSRLSHLENHERSSVTDTIAARAILARENRSISDKTCKKVLAVLGIEDNEQNKERLLKLVV